MQRKVKGKCFIKSVGSINCLYFYDGFIMLHNLDGKLNNSQLKDL